MPLCQAKYPSANPFHNFSHGLDVPQGGFGRVHPFQITRRRLSSSFLAEHCSCLYASTGIGCCCETLHPLRWHFETLERVHWFGKGVPLKDKIWPNVFLMAGTPKSLGCIEIKGSPSARYSTTFPGSAGATSPPYSTGQTLH